MKFPKVNKSAVILSLMVIVLTISPIVMTSGETYTLINERFTISPQQPEIIAQNDFNLTATNEFVLGIPETDAIGTRSDSATYYFEITSTSRVEVYFLDSGNGFLNDYKVFSDNWDGSAPAPPTVYSHRVICDGYIADSFSLDGSVLPKLILYSNDTQVSGDYFWSEGLSAITYTPYYMRSIGSDRPTVDSIHIFYANASIDAYVLTDSQYNTFLLNPNEEPTPINSFADGVGTDLFLNFTAPANEDLHLILWHNLLRDGVTGSITWHYSYQRTFGENYWSLIVVILLIIAFVLTFIFQAKTLPPVVWTLSKAKYYIFSIPWKYTKIGFRWLGRHIVILWKRIRGIELDVEEEEEGKEAEKLKEDEI
ncbi:MAG: hypothetical protein ACTSPM_02665 [Candidatus Heimdallarchaeota archaeon]